MDNEGFGVDRVSSYQSYRLVINGAYGWKGWQHAPISPPPPLLKEYVLQTSTILQNE